MRRLLAMLCVLLFLFTVPGCDLWDNIFGEPTPECPYPTFICDVLDGVDWEGIGETATCLRDCLAPE